MTISRNGRYEIFSTGGRTYCFDDPDTNLVLINSSPEMFSWIRSQDPALWNSMESDPDSNTALYLNPKLYLLWKLRWT